MVSHLKVSVFYSTLDVFVGGAVLSTDQRHCVVFLGKKLYSLSASLHQMYINEYQ